MVKWVVLFVLFLPASLALANPTIDPFTGFSYIMVIGSTLSLEAIAMTMFLLFFSMSPAPVFFALFFGNVAFYFGVFWPLFVVLENVLVAEVLIVAVEGVFVKTISFCATFQLDTFSQLKWRYAFICAAVGNLLSYYVGTTISI